MTTDVTPPGAVTNDAVTSGANITETDGSDDEGPLEEWDSESSFDFDPDDVPLGGYSKFILAKYEGAKLPFKVKQVGNRILFGCFYQKNKDFWVEEEESMLIKRKQFVRNLKVKETVVKGTKRRPVEMLTFAF